MRKQETKKQEFNLQEAFALWRNESKGKSEYFKGLDLNKNKLIGFKVLKKKNEKEPDYRIYDLDAKGNINKEVASLWINKDKNDKNYLTGTTTDKEKLVGFFGDEHQEARPYIRAYFKDNE